MNIQQGGIFEMQSFGRLVLVQAKSGELLSEDILILYSKINESSLSWLLNLVVILANITKAEFSSWQNFKNLFWIFVWKQCEQEN